MKFRLGCWLCCLLLSCLPGFASAAAPAGLAPTEHTPADHTPDNHAPVNHAPADHKPVNHKPVNHAPADRTPANSAPVQWYVRDWPPFNIQQGPAAGSGSYDLMLRLLVAAMPQFQHQVHLASLVKRQQLMQSNKSHCVFGVLKSPEREQQMWFSDIAFYSPALKVVARADHPLWQQMPAAGGINLQALLQLPWTGMLEYKRRYSAQVEQVAGQLLQVTDSANNLVALLKAGRADYIIEYPDRIAYLATEYPDLNLRYAPLQGEPAAVPVYAACQKTPDGRRHIDALNQALRQLKPTAEYQQAWLSGLSPLSQDELKAWAAQDAAFTPATPAIPAIQAH